MTTPGPETDDEVEQEPEPEPVLNRRRYTPSVLTG